MLLKGSHRNWLLLMLGVCIILRAVLIFRADVNWDEFYFLNLVYQHQAGDLQTVLQTFHVHFFKWLPAVSTNEVYQVFAGRLVMFGFAVVTLICIYKIALIYGTQNAALASATGYCAFSFVLDHGASFRADTISASLLMTATLLAFLQKRHFLFYVLIGILIGVAGLVTIKAIFFAPLIGLVLLSYYMTNAYELRALLNCVVAFATAIMTFVILYFLHKASFADLPLSESVDYISSSMDKVILDITILPQLNTLFFAVIKNFTLVLAIFVGIFLVLRILFSSQATDRTKWISAIGLITPLLTVIFYRNSFSYYFIFIFAPACVLISPAYDWVIRNLEDYPKLTNPIRILLMLMVVQLGMNGYSSLQRSAAAQIATLDTVHKMFPEPENYIDRNSMVASFKKQGFFMSSWGFENYHQYGVPIFREILTDKKPRFMIGNVESLDIDSSDIETLVAKRRLLPADETILRKNFIKHWGKIYVAGKRFTGVNAEEEINFEIFVEGTYTYQSTVPSMINGELIFPNGKVFFKQGNHILSSTGQTDEIILRFGENLYLPEAPAPKVPIYFGL